MKKSYRIKKNKDFQIVFKEGKSFANRQFVLYYLKKQDQAHFRVGLSVGKKIGNAVERNKIKRFIRQAFLELKGDLEPHYDYVIIARMPSKDLDYFQVKKSLMHLFKKRELLMGESKYK